jgi:hypothetical protein
MVEATTVLGAMPWFAWVAIVAVICGSVTKMVAMSQAHFERMAMIQAGINPHAKGAPVEEV